MSPLIFLLVEEVIENMMLTDEKFVLCYNSKVYPSFFDICDEVTK